MVIYLLTLGFQKFLQDYGMIWVGDDFNDELGSDDEYRSPVITVNNVPKSGGFNTGMFLFCFVFMITKLSRCYNVRLDGMTDTSFKRFIHDVNKKDMTGISVCIIKH